MEKVLLAIAQILYSMILKNRTMFPTKLIPIYNFVVAILFLIVYYICISGFEFDIMIKERLLIDLAIITGLTTGVHSGVKNLAEWANKNTK